MSRGTRRPEFRRRLRGRRPRYRRAVLLMTLTRRRGRAAVCRTLLNSLRRAGVRCNTGKRKETSEKNGNKSRASVHASLLRLVTACNCTHGIRLAANPFATYEIARSKRTDDRTSRATYSAMPSLATVVLQCEVNWRLGKSSSSLVIVVVHDMTILVVLDDPLVALVRTIGVELDLDAAGGRRSRRTRDCPASRSSSSLFRSSRSAAQEPEGPRVRSRLP